MTNSARKLYGSEAIEVLVGMALAWPSDPPENKDAICRWALEASEQMMAHIAMLQKGLSQIADNHRLEISIRDYARRLLQPNEVTACRPDNV